MDKIDVNQKEWIKQELFRIKQYWDKEVTAKVAQEFEKLKQDCDWVYKGLIPLNEDHISYNARDNTERLQNEWKNITNSVQSNENSISNVRDFITKLWSAHVGDIENVYRLSNNIIDLYANGEIDSDNPLSNNLKHFLTDQDDVNILKQGDITDPNLVETILADQIEAFNLIKDYGSFYCNNNINDTNNNKDTSMAMEFNLNEELILSAHGMMTKNCRWVDQCVIPSGEYKIFANSLRTHLGYINVFCAPDQVANEVNKLFDTLNEAILSVRKDGVQYDPIYLAAWLHANFANIHPFSDGNGRITRLIVSALLLKYDLPPFVVTQFDKIQYFDALGEAQTSEEGIEELMEFIEDRIEYVCEQVKQKLP